jgi:hypothetical protein
MRIKRKVAVAVTICLVVGGLAAAAGAGVLSSLYNTPVSYSMIFGSSGNIYSTKSAPSAPGSGTVGSVLPGQCVLIGVGDFIPSAGCSGLLSAPYELTETPITASSGTITYFSVTTTKPATAGHQIIFSVRLCEHSPFSATSCNTPPGGITVARCTPLPKSYTCSWIGKVPFQQWQPGTTEPCPGSGICHGSDPGVKPDYGLIDVVASRGCGSSCPNGTYDPGNVSWSVSYIK